MYFSHSLSRLLAAVFCFLVVMILPGFAQQTPVHPLDSTATYTTTYPISVDSKQGNQVVIIIYVFAVGNGGIDLVVDPFVSTSPEEEDDPLATISFNEISCVAVNEGLITSALSCPPSGTSAIDVDILLPSSLHLADCPCLSEGGSCQYSPYVTRTCRITSACSTSVIAVNGQSCSPWDCSTAETLQ